MFSQEWEELYATNKHISIWPWSDLVSIVYRIVNNDNPKSVLELGCGAGANVPLFLKLGIDYTGMEGSETIVSYLRRDYAASNCKFICCDFTDTDFGSAYDLVIDRGSITCNTTTSIKRTLANLSRTLKPGTKVICVDWYSTEHSDFSLGDYVDENTRSNITTGQFVGTGTVHFSDKQHILDLLGEAGFVVESMQHKVVKSHVPNSDHVFAAWNFVAVKL